MKALPIHVYKNDFYRGCSNGGISERFDKLLLIHEAGFIDIDENELPDNLVKLVVREVCGEVYKHIEPYAQTYPGCVGWMHGGAYAASSDSRFHDLSSYPLSIHDRQETQKVYDMLSH